MFRKTFHFEHRAVSNGGHLSQLKLKNHVDKNS